MTDTEMDEEKAPAPPTAPRRGSGHRGADMRDTVAEMAERAQMISQEAGSKVSLAMKDVISAAAGLAGFAIESARDLVQYMVRRGQMTQEEADKLIRDAEDAWSKKHKGKKPPPRLEAKPKPVLKPIPYSLPKAAPAAVLPHKSGAAVLKKVAPPKAAKPAAKKAVAKKPAKKAAKQAPKKPAKKAAKPAAKKKPAPKK